MATLHPFRALRPVPEAAEEVACVPYDVIDTEEARQLASGRPRSFLHVIRPEIDLPEGTDEHADEVYERGAENLRRFAASDFFLQEAAPSLYVYRLVMDGREQTGLYGCVSVAEYDDDTILKHEKTRPDKEDDRTRHILTQRAHAEPVMLTYRGLTRINALVEEAKSGAPLYDFVAPDGIRHTVWKAGREDALVEAFQFVEKLYVADGHHRCKAASRAAERLRAAGEEAPGEFGYFPAVLFPMDQMRILPYHRVVRRLPEPPGRFFERLRNHGTLFEDASPQPAEPGQVSIFLDGRWYGFELPDASEPSVVAGLDVSRLSEHLLAPLLGITDPRTDPNLGFVGGIRGTGELERLVREGKAQMAISMYPTTVEQLVDVSDAGLLMPPKSTWFEPKLRSGMLVHLF